MIHPLEAHVRQRIDDIHPGISSAIEEVPVLEASVAERVLESLLGSACAATNYAPIQEGRRLLAKIPRDWLESHIGPAARRALNLDDDVDYRRFLEVLYIMCPHLLPEFVAIGDASPNADVRDAANDFREDDAK